jgi:bifunctional non-homologous end joining protein LigD
VALTTYRRKRDFKRTPEPRGAAARTSRGAAGRFVIQKHAASRLHYDFRLELDGVLKSWAVPKGPSLDPADKRLAVEVEDHPLEYGDFEGVIPAGQYGGGKVLLWDHGSWKPRNDPREGLKRGSLKFDLEGRKLRGGWALVRMGARNGGDKNWLLIKERDAHARSGDAADVVAGRPESVSSGRAIEEIGSARVRGARAGALPRRIAPELCTLVTGPPEGDEWLHEIKFDGYRILCRIENGKVRLLTRNDQDWTDRFREVAEAAGDLPVDRAMIDGEVVVIGPDGASHFQALQNVLREKRHRGLVYFAFDLLHLDGQDLRGAALEDRKAALSRLLRKRAGPIRFSDHVAGRGGEFYAEACRRHLEGVVSKRRDSRYVSARTRDWVKSKCTGRQEVVIGGFTEPRGARGGFGALLLGEFDGKSLRYCGRVGTGFDHETLRDLRQRLDALEVRDSPFADGPKGSRDVHWVEPRLVAEVEFTERTRDGLLRHPSFQGLREDKPAPQAVRETAHRPSANGSGARRAAPASKPARARSRSRARSGAGAVAGITLSHPDKVLYPENGLTKLDLAAYLESVGPWMVPEIRGRPLMLLRCPDGRSGGCFFQKHPSGTTDPSLDRVPVRESGGRTTYLAVHDPAGLVSLIQGGALEIHMWGARADRLEQPDRMVFDLDPDPSVEWTRVVDAARRTREILGEADLESFVKTTGGKGLHVVVPLRRGPTWDDLKTFSAGVAARLLATDPDRFTTQASKARRHGRIFIDTLRNRRGATSIAPYSPRAREGAPVSMPLDWNDVTPRLQPSRFSVASASRFVGARASDPWKSMDSIRQTLTAAMLRRIAAPRRTTPRKESR